MTRAATRAASRRRTRARPGRRAARSSPSATASEPPSTSTRTWSPTSPRRCATAADAHAPVPHDCVSPAPRSHTRIVEPVGAGHRDELDVDAAREPRVVLDARAVLGDAEPRRDRRRRTTKCGLPMPAASPWYVVPSTIASRSNGDVGVDRDLIGLERDAAHVDVGRDHVARRVALDRHVRGDRPRCRRRARRRGAGRRGRRPTPGSARRCRSSRPRPPSAFTSVIEQSAPSRPGPDRDEPVGADAAVAVAQRRHDDRVELGLDRVERDLHEEVVAGRVQLRRARGRS